ncbi:MAG TPA: ribonuclease G [Clostridiales bacterium]|nr:ribonuclease G [Clostridiales bacterium]
MLELIVNKNEDLETIVLVENGKMLEHYISTENERKRRLEGNIYIAQVGDIINGMQAAFIDYGEKKKGFIHLKDVLPKVDETKEKIDNTINISKVIKPNQKIMIQIKKDSDFTKGARVSTHISLPGKYIVLMPNTDFITVSQKISSTDIKKELTKFIKTNLPEGFGAIIRTSCEKASFDDMTNDINALLDRWEKIQTRYKQVKTAPKLIWESEGIIEKIITDLSSKDLENIVTNDKEVYKKLSNNYNKSKLKIMYEDKPNLLEKYELEKQIEKLQDRKVWLNCGGFITIDKTEALTAIDVNTGKFTGKKDLESTIFKVNKEATIEIAKQLRLRDIGGIIIIDYIDMADKENKKKIEELLKEEFKSDRAKTQVEGFTKLNLMELTRKHICSHLNG